MQNIKLAVTVQGQEPWTVTTTPLALVETERKFGISYLQMFGNDMRMEVINFVAWRSSKHRGFTDISVFEKFLLILEDVDIVTDEVTADPNFEEAVIPGPSPSLPTEQGSLPENSWMPPETSST